MKKLWARVLGAVLAGAAVGPGAAAFAQDASASAPADPAKLSEANSIIEIMFPPAERDRTFDAMVQQILAQFRQGIPEDLVSDPGLKAILNKYFDSIPVRLKPTIQRHLPKIMEATAIAYTHEFSLDELKQIHVFAQTDAGRHYFQRASVLIGDPAVAAANADYLKDIQADSLTMQGELRDEVVAYVQAHPDVAQKLAKEAKSE
ncbi:MAG TPA: hypothetical protein VF418_14985 [Sphingomonadaceae bacterium]